MALSLGIYSVPFRVSKPRDPRVQFPPAGETAKATLKAKEAEEQGSLAGILIHTNKIWYHEHLGQRWKGETGVGKELLSAPFASLHLLRHLSCSSALCLDKTHSGSPTSPHWLGLCAFAQAGLPCAIPSCPGTSLVVQWLRIRLPVQGTRVPSLVREDPTCCGATKLVCHNWRVASARCN